MGLQSRGSQGAGVQRWRAPWLMGTAIMVFPGLGIPNNSNPGSGGSQSLISLRNVWEKPVGSQEKPQQCLGELGHRAGVSAQKSPLSTAGSFKSADSHGDRNHQPGHIWLLDHPFTEIQANMELETFCLGLQRDPKLDSQVFEAGLSCVEEILIFWASSPKIKLGGNLEASSGRDISRAGHTQWPREQRSEEISENRKSWALWSLWVPSNSAFSVWFPGKSCLDFLFLWKAVDYWQSANKAHLGCLDSLWKI